jgi:hypothetical protein
METSIAPLRTLSQREEQFAQHLAVFDDPAAAYLASGECSSANRASVRHMAYAMRARPWVSARITTLRNAIAAAGPKATQAALVADLQDALAVEVAEIVRLEVVHCQDCYSSPAYADWWLNATAAALDAGSIELPPEPLLVGHFDPHRTPWSHCGRCLGAGRQVVYATPTSELSSAARRLVRGFETHSDGTVKKVLLADLTQLRQELHRTVPGFYAPTSSVSLNLNADIKPLKRGMTVEEALAIMQEVAPVSDDSTVSVQS